MGGLGAEGEPWAYRQAAAPERQPRPVTVLLASPSSLPKQPVRAGGWNSTQEAERGQM